jgi:hypothetical protein
MPEETIDAGLLEQTKTQIRKLVGEIAELAESDIQPADFHVEFLNRVVAAVAANAGALWLLDGRGTLKLQHQLEMRQTGLLSDRQRAAPHEALLGLMLQAAQAQIIPPGAAVEGMPNAGNPTNLAMIIAPIVVDKQTVALVEVLMDPNRRAASQKSTLRFVSDLCDLASQYLKNRQVRQVLSQQKLWNQLEGFTHAAHQSLDLKETCFAVANEGKRLVGCDRLSVALKLSAAARVMVEAVSGQEIVEQRSNLVREMTRLCKAVLQSGEELVYTGNTEGFPPEIRDALEIYVDESGAKAIAISLLYKPETETNKERVPFGCLIAEQIGDEMAPTDMQARCEVVSRHASTALWNAQEHHRIFLLPVLKVVGSPWRFFRGRTGAKILAVLGLILGTILVMALWPWKLTIEGRGSILPYTRQMTYAPLKGVIIQVPHEHGDLVHGPHADAQGREVPGDVLAQLESKELEAELKRHIAERAEAESQIVTLERKINNANTPPDEQRQNFGEKKQAEIKRDGAIQQIAIIEEQLAMMAIRAPCDGIVTTWDVKKNFLNRPVDVGQELIQVADVSGVWELEVNVQDHDMGPILEAQSRLHRLMAPVVEARAKLDALCRDGISAKNAEAIEEVVADELRPALQKAERSGARDLVDFGPPMAEVQHFARAVAKVHDGSADAGANAATAKSALDEALDRATTLSAYFVSATDPENRYQGYVRRIAARAETVEQQHVVKVTVGFSDAVRREFLKRNQSLRPGAEVRARINCGDARMAYALMRDVVHFWHENVTFRWPFVR